MMSEKFSYDASNSETYDRHDPSPESAMTPKEQILALKENIKMTEGRIKLLTKEFDVMAEDENFTSSAQLENIVSKIDDLGTEQIILRDKILAIIDQMSRLDAENLTTQLRKPGASN